MSGNKPCLKIAVKPKAGEGGRTSVMAFWRRDNGKLSGDLDRRVKRMVLLLDDGTKVDVQRGADGKLTHFCDCFEGDTAGGRTRSPGNGRAPSADDLLGDGGGPPPIDDFDPDTF